MLNKIKETPTLKINMMNDLEEKAGELRHKKTPEERIDALLQAFELFCEETSRLEVAYGQLKEEFSSINQELAVSNEELKAKLIEIGQLSHYLDNILSHISQGLLFIDYQGVIKTFNHAAESLLGKKKQQVENHLFNEIFNDNVFGFSMQEALIHKKAPSFIRLTHTSESSKEDKLLEIETKFIDKEKIEGLIVTLRDTTEIQTLELIANRADRMKALGEMASLVAHEIRNPLGGIKGFAALLKRDLKDQPELEKMADFILEGSNNLNDRVSQILDYTRPVKPHLVPVSLENLLNELKSFIEMDSNLTSHPQINIKITPSKLEASLDYQLIKAALLNLCMNSVHAMQDLDEKRRILEIEAKMEKHHLHIEVKDLGKGIAPEQLEKLFTPFFSTKSFGNGLGLVEVQKIVQAHGGSISVSSKIDEGTSFTIKIPQRV